jgi:hypothetical protein
MSDAEGEVNARGAAQAQLTAENTSLRNVNETLKSEVRKLEEERNSLLLALRLMSTSESKEIPLSVDKNQSRPQDKPDNSNSDCQRPQNGRNSGHNSTQPEQPNQQRRNQQRGNSQNENSFTKKPVTVIVGDSMVKNVRGWELSCKRYRKSYRQILFWGHNRGYGRLPEASIEKGARESYST